MCWSILVHVLNQNIFHVLVQYLVHMVTCMCWNVASSCPVLHSYVFRAPVPVWGLILMFLELLYWFGVFWSKLIDLTLKSNRMVLSVHVCTFQWYFTRPMSFSDILRKSRSFDAPEPIFQKKTQFQTEGELCSRGLHPVDPHVEEGKRVWEKNMCHFTFV